MSEIRRWMNGKTGHVVFLGVLLVYLFAANPVYVHFFMKNGKPASANASLPPASQKVVFALNTLQPVRVEGQNLYELRGYAFDPLDPARKNTITVILSDGSRTFSFSTRPVQYPNMIESYAGYTPAMNGAEFSMLVSNDGLAPGTYQVGILLEPAASSGGDAVRSFVQTGSILKKTHNTTQYVPAH